MTSTFDDAEVVARRSERFTALLAATDDAPRRVAFPSARVAQAARRGVLVRRLAAAAAVVLVLAGTVGVPPVRAWIVSNAKALWSLVSPPPAPNTPAVPPQVVPEGGIVGTVTIPVAPYKFVVDVVSWQAGGTLVVEPTDDSVATAVVTGEGSGAELLVLPGGLRILNGPRVTASYLVRVPRRVGTLTILVAGRERTEAQLRWSHPGTTRADRWTLQLDARR